MTDGLSEAYRASREEERRIVRRKEYLAAALEHLTFGTQATMTAVIETSEMVLAAKRCGDDGSLTRQEAEVLAFAAATAKFEALARGDKAEWANFLLKDIGIDDAETRQKFLELSPFRGCLVVLSRFVSGWEMVGDTSKLISLIARGPATIESVYEATVHLPNSTHRTTRVHIYRVTPSK